MLNTNLVLVDGLPGSGKSTTAQWLWLQMCDQGFDAEWFFEQQLSHPIYRFDSFAQAVFCSSLGRLPKIREHLLGRWAKLANSLFRTPRIVILESTFFQTTIGWLLLLDVAPDEIVRYAARIIDNVAKVNPVLVYLYQANPAAALRQVRAERGEWFENLSLVELRKSPYGRRRSTKAFDDVVDYFLKVRRMTDDVYSKFPFTKIAIDTTERNWTQYRTNIAETLCVPGMIDRGVHLEHQRFAGTYRSGLPLRTSVEIAADGQGLYLPDYATTRLIHKAGDTFCVQGLCLELSFVDRNGQAEMHCKGNLARIPRTLKRVGRPAEHV